MAFLSQTIRSLTIDLSSFFAEGSFCFVANGCGFVRLTGPGFICSDSCRRYAWFLGQCSAKTTALNRPCHLRGLGAHFNNIRNFSLRSRSRFDIFPVVIVVQALSTGSVKTIPRSCRNLFVPWLFLLDQHCLWWLILTLVFVVAAVSGVS